MKKVCLTQTLHTICFAFTLLCMSTMQVSAQGVTTSSITGIILDAKGAAVPFAVVTAKHEPSGSIYGIETSEDGRFTLPAVRIGGPYTITVQMSGLKMKDPTVGQNIFLSLGESYNIKTTLVEESTILEAVIVTGDRNGIINGSKNGTGTNIDKQMLSSMPTLSRSFNDIIRLTPQGKSSSVASTAGTGLSFSGQDSRANNLTIDGSLFNNTFGLASGNGGQTNSQPISLDAIDQIQINIAPFDVRQAGFTGAGINAVTKSGTNNLYVNGFYNMRNESYVGNKADTSTLTVNKFDVKQYGISIGGPIIKNKLFFFANYEGERRSDPQLITANRNTGGANENKRVNASALDSLSAFLQQKYNYSTGAYDNYNYATASDKALLKLDWNIDNSNHASFRVNFLNSKRDVGTSNSGVVSGSRNGSVSSGIDFQNTNYIINNDIYSGIFELNSIISRKLSNNFQVGYTYNRDYRNSGGGIFPLVDIQNGASDPNTLVSFGYEPFTLDNILYTTTVQVKDDVSFYLKNHTITAGVAFQAYQFENSFKPRGQGQYTYSSLADFYAAANGSTTVIPKQFFQTTPGPGLTDIPFAITKAYQPGIYIQDEFKSLQDRLRVTAGLRIDVPIFGNSTAIQNTEAAGFNFIDGYGNPVKFNTGDLPTTQYLFSPRLGFNLDVLGDKTLQLRGGSGLFTGFPPFVFLSNAVSNNGVSQGQTLISGKYVPFSPDVRANLPTNASALLTYNLATVDPNFKWPQTWRSNLGVDFKLPFGVIGTVEGIFSKVVNNVNYYNANQALPKGAYTASSGENDNRPYFGIQKPANTAARDSLNRVNYKITDNTVLNNTDQGYSFSVTTKLEKPFKNSNWYAMLAYNYAVAKDLFSAGSIANSSWTGFPSVNGNNRPDLSLSDNDLRQRIIGAFSYNIPEGKFASTLVSLFMQSSPLGNASFAVAGDLNGDGLTANDLMYVPNNANNLQFANATINGKTVDIATQKAALETFISNNDYLTSRRGQYAERNGWVLPFLTTFDLTIAQNFYVSVKEKKNTIQVRMDMYNVGNFINNSWGVGNNFLTSPLQFNKYDAATNQPVYTLRTAYFNSANQFPASPVAVRATLADVWQLQLGVRYIFN